MALAGSYFGSPATTAASEQTKPTTKPLGSGAASQFGATPQAPPAAPQSPAGASGGPQPMQLPLVNPRPVAPPQPTVPGAQAPGGASAVPVNPQVSKPGGGLMGAIPGMMQGFDMHGELQHRGMDGLLANGQGGASPTGDHPTVPGAQIQQFGPGQDLRYSQVLPGQEADRFGLAQNAVQRFFDANQPQYTGILRQATQAAAANGRLGSGMLTNTYGDAAKQFTDALNRTKQQSLDAALEGTIGDQANYRNEARGERAYQQGASQQSLDNSVRGSQLQEDLTQGGFNRSEQQLHDLLGIAYQGNPSGTYLDAGQQQQGAANQGSGGLAELLRQYAYGQSVTPPPGTPPGAGGQLGQASNYQFPGYQQNYGIGANQGTYK